MVFFSSVRIYAVFRHVFSSSNFFCKYLQTNTGLPVWLSDMRNSRKKKKDNSVWAQNEWTSNYANLFLWKLPFSNSIIFSRIKETVGTYRQKIIRSNYNLTWICFTWYYNLFECCKSWKNNLHYKLIMQNYSIQENLFSSPNKPINDIPACRFKLFQSNV